MQGPYLRKYGVETKIPFVLYEVDGVDLRVDAADGGSDCTIMKNEGAEATCENDFVDEGNGYSITLTATEMTAARIVVYVIDSATKVWLDDSIVIETYGNASAQHAIDLDDSVRAGLTALPSANADAAGGLPISDAGELDLDTKLANTNEITTARMGALTDWINGGRLDNLLDAIPTTAMRGTDNAALASVVGALADAAAAGEVTEADTLMKYIKQLINILIGTPGIAAFPAEAAPANSVSLAEVIRAIHADVTGLNGDAMKGTDGANTTVPDAAGTAATPADVATALSNINLDHLMKEPVSNRDTMPEVVDDTVLANIMTKTDGDTSDFDHATDSLEAIKDASSGNITDIMGTALTETTEGNLAANLSTFLDNADSLTAKTVDDVGAPAAGGGSPLVLGAGDVGDFKENGKVYFLWNTIDRSGASVAPTTAGTLRVYKDDGTGEVTAPTGITDTRTFDTVVGQHECKIDLNSSLNNFYEKGKNYSVVLVGAVIDTKTVNAKIASFSIENRWANVHFVYGGK